MNLIKADLSEGSGFVSVPKMMEEPMVPTIDSTCIPVFVFVENSSVPSIRMVLILALITPSTRSVFPAGI